MKSLVWITGAVLALSLTAHAQVLADESVNEGLAIPQMSFDQEDNAMDELDPYAPDIEEQLQEMDRIYTEETGHSPFLWNWISIKGQQTQQGCVREKCKVWLRINKDRQLAYLYIDGKMVDSFPVSTGIDGRRTPNFDQRPNGRIYDRYTSTKFPGGDYNGLGNMPYAVFITGGFAVHGTSKGNWKKLGTKASHGCVRMHPDKAYRFNRLVRDNGIYKTWITVE
jgi:Uncharacterized protein conserved in bacteria